MRQTEDHDYYCWQRDCWRLADSEYAPTVQICKVHAELRDADSDLLEWETARDILKPWLESAKVINSYLAEIMEHALSEAEDAIAACQARIDRAEAEL